LPGLFDRNGVYSENNEFFKDEPERNISFQRAYLQWITGTSTPEIIHCHDHHTGLIPYFIKNAPEFQELKEIPTVFTIHNGQYHGAFSWDFKNLLPFSPDNKLGLIDWDKGINPLSSAIRCAWKVNTVSPTYMIELASKEGSLNHLYKNEKNKLLGIINGIDYDTWNPKKDTYLEHHYQDNIDDFKMKNKSVLIKQFKLDAKQPLFAFIGRFANEKGLDILLDSIENLLQNKFKSSFLILGTGDKILEEKCTLLNKRFKGKFHAELSYNEALAHQIYAGADFLLMPSRVEPCGLNQMYSMRYGTIPIVHGIGGLEDSVIDDYNGLKFHGLSIENILKIIKKARNLYINKKTKSLINQAFKTDFSWEASSKKYLKLYHELKEISN